jgi:hypothetical protein
MARTRIGFVVLGVVACGDTRGSQDSVSATATVTASASASASATEGTDAGDAGTTSASADDGDDDDDADTGAKFDVEIAGDGGIGPDTSSSCEQDIDIVFVMDVSTSMGPFLSTLADEILVVDEAIAALDLPNPPHYGLVVFVDDAAILNAAGPYPDVATLRADFMEWSAFTSTNYQVGGGNYNTTWPENSLDGLYLAAAGFQWRPQGDQTLRMIIHTTDDTFWDGPTMQNGVAIEHGYEEIVGALQDREIRMFTFAAQIGGMCECEDVTPGWSTPYMGMPPIPESTDGDVFDLDLVLAGQLSLSAAINGAIEENMCEPYPPQG